MRKIFNKTQILLMIGIMILIFVSGCSLIINRETYISTLDCVWEDADNLLVAELIGYKYEHYTDEYGISVVRINIRSGKQNLILKTTEYTDAYFRGFRQTDRNIYFLTFDNAYVLQNDNFVSVHDCPYFDISNDEKIYSSMNYEEINIINNESGDTIISREFRMLMPRYVLDIDNMRVYFLSTNEVKVNLQAYLDISLDTILPFWFISYPDSVTRTIDNEYITYPMPRMNGDTIEIMPPVMDMEDYYVGIYPPFNPNNYYYRPFKDWYANENGEYVVGNRGYVHIYNKNDSLQSEFILIDP